MSIQSHHPIGIFDSGIGGLTAAHAITQLMPKENLVYFGDVAHLPYGDKSAIAIQNYSLKICDVLLQKQCKIILVACFSASSAAYEAVKQYVGNRAHVMDVIDPVISYLEKHKANKHIGLIGTKQTINSNVFKKKLAVSKLDIQLSSLATPLLAPMIEEGFYSHKITDCALEEYLTRPELQHIDTLILGCTHYPLIKQRIAKFYQQRIHVIDPSEIIADAVKQILDANELLNIAPVEPTKTFYVSDYTDAFAKAAHMFFRETIQLEKYPLWD